MDRALLSRIREVLRGNAVADPGLDQVTVRELSRGRARTLRLRLPDGRSWVVRVATRPDPDAPALDHLVANTAGAARRGLTPAVVAASSEGDILITEHVGGRPLTVADLHRSEGRDRVGRHLARLHSERTFANEIDPLRGLSTPPSPLDPPEVIEVRARLAELRATLGPGPLVDTHGDLVPANVLADDTTIMLIDWEYSGAGDPRLDVAYLAVTAGLDRREGRHLADAWGGDLSEEAFGAARQLITAMIARWTAHRPWAT